MAEPSKTSRPKGAIAQAAPRIAPRRKTADRRLRTLERLNNGLSVAHIARVDQLTAPRARQIIAEMLAGRETDPPAGFELTGELDRYHGFAPAQIPGAPDLAGGPRSRQNRARREVEGKFCPSQAFEIPRNAEGISGSETTHRLAAPKSRSVAPNPARGEAEGKCSASQDREVARKWRRNGLKRLNPRPEMVSPRRPRTYNIWYPGAQLMGGSLGVTREIFCIRGAKLRALL